MQKEEIAVAKKFLVAFDSNATKKNNQSLMLLNLLLSKPDVSYEKALDSQGGQIKIRSFDRKVSRLTDKLSESLLLDVNVKRTDAYSSWYQTKQDLRKKIILGQTLFGRGMESAALEIYDKVIKEATAFELYDEFIEALHYKQLESGLRLGPTEFDTYTDAIAFYKFCREAKFRAFDWYYKYYMHIDSKSKRDVSKSKELLTQAIEGLEEDYKKTESDYVNFFLHFLKMEYCRIEKDYQACKEIGIQLIALLESSQTLYMKSRLGMVYSDLADNELFALQFSSCTAFAKKAQTYFKKGSYNYIIAKQWEFYGVFYGADLKKARLVVDQLLSISQLKNMPFELNKALYFKACILFLEKEFKEAYFILQGIKEIEKDREGWNLGIRMLSIMCHIEMNLLDLADSKIESLRKHMERLQGIGVAKQRDLIILRILKELEKKSFDFEACYRQKNELFRLLDSNDEAYSWQIRTHEIIVFELWYAAKMNAKDYQFTVPKKTAIRQKKVIEKSNR